MCLIWKNAEKKLSKEVKIKKNIYNPPVFGYAAVLLAFIRAFVLAKFIAIFNFIIIILCVIAVVLTIVIAFIAIVGIIGTFSTHA